MDNFRETVEDELLQISGVRPFSNKINKYIEDLKDGTFGFSYLGFLLYCNGRNPRGLSNKNPNGLVYFDKENLFGIGIFRRELEKEKGNLMIVAPRGLNGSTVKVIDLFVKKVAERIPN